MDLKADGSSLMDFFENHEHRLLHKWLHYFEIYDRHFSKFRNKPLSLIEFGVSHGGSLQMWRHYFGPQARIYGVDIDPRCASLDEENITVLMGDQDNRDSIRAIRDSLPKFDIIIDDGGHTMSQQINTLEEMYGHLKDGGVYLCEDLHTSYWPQWGNGVRKPGSFIEYSKRLVDQLNAWYSEEAGFEVDEFTLNAFSLHYYDSILVIEKRRMKPPEHRIYGTPISGECRRAAGSGPTKSSLSVRPRRGNGPCQGLPARGAGIAAKNCYQLLPRRVNPRAWCAAAG